jgi:hypothetical protein
MDTKKNAAAVALGRRGGSVTSARKADAARINGRKGGWPKGRSRKPATVRIPVAFLNDHDQRALPTPTVVKSTARHAWIRRDDPAFAELLDDARFYAEGNVDGVPQVVAAARALVRAMTEGDAR